MSGIAAADGAITGVYLKARSRHMASIRDSESEQGGPGLRLPPYSVASLGLFPLPRSSLVPSSGLVQQIKPDADPCDMLVL